MLRHDGQERARVIGVLDAFRAAERAGADAVERWIAACADARLRGGLRVIEARDRRHAALAEARLRALGGVPAAAASRELTAVCVVVADPAVSDRSKLAMLCARFAASGDGGALERVVALVGGDAETHALLASIGDDERVSVRWLARMHGVLEQEGA
jgi:hypothetical protein